MKKVNKKLLIILISLTLVAIGVGACYWKNSGKNIVIAPTESGAIEFEECLKVGNLYKEMYPRICVSDGIKYFENEGKLVNYKDKIIIDYPTPNDLVTSPLIVRGKARGTWYFEADFPVTLDMGPGEIVNTYASAQGEWMTEDYVDFTVNVVFPDTDSEDGMLTFIRSNPSDLEENNDSVSIPVRFK